MTKPVLTLKKGGPGSGNYGHQGLAGVWGGSSPKSGGVSGGSDKGDLRESETYVTLYHATHDEFIESIKFKGLRRGKEWIGRPPSVYFVESLEEAKKLGISFLGHEWYARLAGRDSDIRDVAIIKFRVPKYIYDHKITDDIANQDFKVKTAGRIEANVKPGDILSAEVLFYRYIFKDIGGWQFEEISREEAIAETDPKYVRKEEGVTIYQIVVFTKDVEEFIEEKQLPIDEKSKQALMTLRKQMFFDHTDTLAEQLFTGEISLGQWQEQFKDYMRQYYSSMAAIGKGGWDVMEPADWGRLGPLMKDQYRYLQGFAEHIDVERDTISLKYIKARSRLYGEGGNRAVTHMEAGYIFEEKLPWLPGDGSTECLNRCHCRWVFSLVGKEGDFNIVKATWRLGEADHCTTCVDRDGYTISITVHELITVPSKIGGY